MPAVFRILGPIAATIDGVQRRLGSPKERAVLALLLMSAGQVVSTDRLMSELWGDRPPATASATVQAYVSRLRRDLGDGPHRTTDSTAPRILRQTRGYLLDVNPDVVDAYLLARQLNAARARLDDEPAVVADQLERILLECAGQPFADVLHLLGPVAAVEAIRLAELQLTARELRLQALLRSGRHAAAAADAAVLIAQHPSREELYAIRMLALYGACRQTEALATYEQARRWLAEEFGIEPSPPLRRLHSRVLAQDPGLLWAAPDAFMARPAATHISAA